jgi:hypothetical protein
MEKFREKKFNEYYKEMLRIEQNQLDEAGLMLFCRMAE